MKISLITDEISSDPETAIELGVAWGVRDFELRGYFTGRAPRLSSYQKQHLRDILADYDAQIIAISPGLFKMPLPNKQAGRASLGWLEQGEYESWSTERGLLRQHLEELLPETLDYANELGAKKVLIFGFDRAGAPPGEAPEEALTILRLAAERAAAAGLDLALENEAGFWADTGRRSAQIMRAVGHPNLGLNWDPGNAFCADDEPYPAGYSEVRNFVQHVHFKDAARDQQGEAQYVLHGEIDWAGQIQALADDSFDGFISVETHIRPKVAAARSSLERLRSLIAAIHSSVEHS